MLEKSLQKFATENFSDKYYACLHGETKKIRPLALAVKRRRSVLARPFAKSELIILEGLEKYVESKGEEEFREALNAMVTEEELIMPNKNSLGASSKEFGVDVARQVEVTVKLHADWGDIRLGKLNQQYITDLDIRGLLAKTILDTNKMEPYEDDKLLLITSVIYSDKFELTGERVDEMEVTAGVDPIPKSANIVFPQVNARFSSTNIPPGVAARNIPGPLLFKCCHVEYNKETNRMDIPKGEYIRKTDYKRTTDPEPKEDDAEYYDTFVNSNLDETDSAVLIPGDLEKLDTVEREVLLPEKNRVLRKARISKYRQWFERSLSTDDEKLTLDEPLTSEDCTFLRQAYFSCNQDSVSLELTGLTKNDLQGFGIVFKALDELPDEKWSELEKDLYGAV